MHNIIQRVFFFSKIIMRWNYPWHNIWRIWPVNTTKLEITIELFLVVFSGKWITACNLEGSSIYFENASELWSLRLYLIRKIHWNALLWDNLQQKFDLVSSRHVFLGVSNGKGTSGRDPYCHFGNEHQWYQWYHQPNSNE